MFYVLAIPGEPMVYPYTLTDLRRAHPQTSFPSVDFDASDWFCFPVQPTEPPVADGKNAVRDTAELVDGVWVERWRLEDITQEQIDAQWVGIRNQRNAKLVECDWTQLPDAPVDAASWATYRQALRDITLQTDPFNITWPVPPT